MAALYHLFPEFRELWSGDPRYRAGHASVLHWCACFKSGLVEINSGLPRLWATFYTVRLQTQSLHVDHCFHHVFTYDNRSVCAIACYRLLVYVLIVFCWVCWWWLKFCLTLVCWILYKTLLVNTHFTARRSYASAVVGVVILSVRPSVCHTRALWLIQRTYRRYFYHERAILLVFWCQRSRRNSNGVIPDGAPNRGGVG